LRLDIHLGAAFPAASPSGVQRSTFVDRLEFGRGGATFRAAMGFVHSALRMAHDAWGL